MKSIRVKFAAIKYHCGCVSAIDKNEMAFCAKHGAVDELLRAAKELASKFPYFGNITVKDADRLTKAITKAEGGA